MNTGHERRETLILNFLKLQVNQIILIIISISNERKQFALKKDFVKQKFIFKHSE